MVEDKRRGYACSAVAAYQRHVGKLEAYKRQAAETVHSAHQGVVGERLGGISLTVLSNRGFSGAYGDTILYKMKDEKGNMFSWFASGNVSMETGKTYRLDATVKAHSEYNGVKETQLTRGKVL